MGDRKRDSEGLKQRDKELTLYVQIAPFKK